MLARQYHPDVNPDPRAEERFKRISAAYSVLSDPKERAKYDLQIGAAWRRTGVSERERRARKRKAAPQAETFDWTHWTTPLDEQDIAAIVIQQLGRFVSRDSITIRLCETCDVAWSQAEAFVHRVETNHRHAIARRQAPLLLVVSVAMLVGGIVLIPVFVALFSAELAVVSVGMMAGGMMGTWQTLKTLVSNRNEVHR